MKIAFFTDTFLPQINGVAKTLSMFADYMDKHGIEYRIFAPSFQDQEFHNKVVRSRSFKFLLYPQCRLSLPNYFSIARELDDFNPDIIHVVTEYNLGLCGLKYAKSRNIPVVSSYETNISQYLEYYGFRLLKTPSWKYFKWFHNKCDINYCPSSATANLLKQHGFVNPSIWERGIETDRFSPDFRDEELRKAMGLDNKIVFLYVGRVSPEKDLDIFIKTAKRLNEKYMNRIHFVMVGDGPSLSDLKAAAPANMTFTGFLRGKALSALYASSDVFLFTSPTETLGFVILEAMASGLSIVACNGGGVSDNLIDEYNGLACREKNYDDFYYKSEQVLLDSTLRETLSANARSFALAKSWDSTFDRLIMSYQGLIDTKVEHSFVNCS
jgi:glycosyltransferase involved in cell wall biosynthesis